MEKEESTIPKNKFRVTFEFETIPYNEETAHLLGGFMPDYPVTTFAKEDVGRFKQHAISQILNLKMQEAFGDGRRDKNLLAYYERLEDMYNQMGDSVKVELVE